MCGLFEGYNCRNRQCQRDAIGNAPLASELEGLLRRDEDRGMKMFRLRLTPP
jgi:hypothetical protein